MAPEKPPMKRVMRWPSAEEAKRIADRYYASRMALLEQNAEAIKALVRWRNEFGIKPNTNTDRAVVFTIRALQGRYPANWQARVEAMLQRQKTLGGNMHLRIGLAAESIYAKALENRLKSMQPSKERDELLDNLALRKKFISEYKLLVRSKAKTGTVNVRYGDADVPEWYNVSMPANPFFREFAAKHGIRHE